MTAHGQRDHSRWSASSTARNWACPGALAMAERVTTPEKENEAAAWGTACHQLAERCLRDGVDASVFIDEIEYTKEHEIAIDDEMAETAQVFIDYVRAASSGGKPLWLEERFSLDSLQPPFEAGGTCDAIIYHAGKRMLEVIDLKGGRGVVVEVLGNPQLRTYALGAMLAHGDMKVDQVKVTIIQPRAPHKDGRIRSETFHVADLVEWTADLVAAMRRSEEAIAKRAELPDGPWSDAYLKAGDHCKFCRAAAICPALEKKAFDAAGVWFDDLNQPRLANTPDSLSPEELAVRLDAADMISDWISAMRAYAHSLAESGTEIPNYQLVEKIGRRTWATDDEAKIVADLHNVAGLDDDRIYNRKLKSPAQIEKLGKEVKKKIENMWHAPVKGTNLVRADKTTRPAVKSAPEKFFDVLN